MPRPLTDEEYREMLSPTFTLTVTCAWFNCLVPLPFGDLLCERHTAERRAACRQSPENPVCGLGSHRWVMRPCEVDAFTRKRLSCGNMT